MANRSMASKVERARKQSIAAAQDMLGRAKVAVLPDTAPKFRPAQTWEQAKPKPILDRNGKRVTYAPARATPKVTPLMAAWCNDDTVRLYRDGKRVS